MPQEQKPSHEQTQQPPVQFTNYPAEKDPDLAVNDGPKVPVVPGPNTIQSQPNRSKVFNRLTGAAVVGVIALGGVGGAVLHNMNSQAPAPEPAPEHAQDAPKTTLDKINDTGRNLANGVITILARPGSGAAAHSGDSIGNKTAIVGPDGIEGTKDDLTDAPESQIAFDAAKKKIYILSDQGYAVQSTKSKKPVEEFTYVFAELAVNDENPILSVEGQPTLEDFQKAVSAENPLTVNRMTAELRIGGVQPRPTVEFTFENGKPHIKVDEFSQAGNDSGVTEAVEGTAAFDEEAARLIQVALAASQDLTKQ